MGTNHELAGRVAGPAYVPRDPGSDVVSAVVREHLQDLVDEAAADDRRFPQFVLDQLEALPACGDFLRGFARMYCSACRSSRIVPFC